MVRINRQYSPTADHVAQYDTLYDLYTTLIRASWPVWEKFAQVGIEKW